MINSYTKIALTNLGKYNEGELVYKWLDLPFTEEELEETKKAIGIDGVIYEEYFISDWESDIEGLEIGEYEDIEALNETIKAYENLSEWEAEIVTAAVECFGYSINEVIERIDDFHLYSDIHDEYDLGYYWAVESGCYELDFNNPLSRYIDYEAFGRDINFETSGGFTSKGYIEEIR